MNRPHRAGRTPVAVVAAAALHGLLLAVLLRLPARPPMPVAPGPPAERGTTEVSVEPEPIAAEWAAPSKAPSAPPRAFPSPGAARAPEASAPALAAVVAAQPPGSSRAAAPGIEPRSDASGVGAPQGLSLEQLGIRPGGGPLYLAPSGGGAPAAGTGPTAAGDGKSEASRRTANMLRSELAARDTAIGLGPDGPVVAALEDQARRSSALGHATFDVTVDAGGLVVSLAAASATESRDDWSAIGAKSLLALKGKPLRRRGPLSMRIEVDARIALPSGADPGLGVSVLGIPLKKGDGPKASQISVGGTPYGPGVSGKFDVADIGAQTRRVVHAHVVSVTTL